jgi:hypothetical protein
MTRAEFYGMPVGEFWEAMRAYGRREEANARHLGELARGAALRLFNVQLRRKDQLKEPADFWPMPWDAKESNAPEMSSEQKERSIGRLLNIVKKQGW